MKYILSFTISVFFACFVNAANPESTFEVYFDSDDFKLSRHEEQLFKTHIKKLKNESHQYFVEIIGHTDADGNFKYNQQLSEKRADFIAHLLQQNNFQYHQIIKKGVAYKQPVADNLSEEGKSQNRRVEVLFYNNNSVAVNKLGNHALNTEIMSIDPSVKNELLFESGISLKIPPNAFVNENGEDVSGLVNILVTPYNNYKDFIVSGIPMSFINGKDEFFISAGMLSIDATFNDEKVYLKNGRKIDVELPATSAESDMSLFQFAENQSEWGLLPQPEGFATTKLIEKKGFRSREKLIYRECCKGVQNAYYKVSDTLVVLNAMAELKRNNFITPEILQLSKYTLELIRIENSITKYEQKIYSLEHEYIAELVSTQNEENFVSFRLLRGQNQVYNQIKLLNNFHLKPVSGNLEQLTSQNISEIEILSLNDRIVSLQLLFQDNEKMELVLEMVPKYLGKMDKSSKKNLIDNFNELKESRLWLIEDFNQKLQGEMNKKYLLEQEMQAYEAALSKNVFEKEEMLKRFFVLHKTFVTGKTFFEVEKTELKPGEFEVWVVNNQKATGFLKETSAKLLNAVKCSNSDYRILERKLITEEYTFKGTPLNATLNDLAYSFAIEGLGTFNVDKLMKIEENIYVNVKRYQSETGETLPITNVFVVNSSFNGVIEFRNNQKYNPYNFVVKDSENALVAVDIHGNAYKISSDLFGKSINKQSIPVELKLVKIDINQELNIFASK